MILKQRLFGFETWDVGIFTQFGSFILLEVLPIIPHRYQGVVWRPGALPPHWFPGYPIPTAPVITF
jgi:hypothetical protein